MASHLKVKDFIHLQVFFFYIFFAIIIIIIIIIIITIILNNDCHIDLSNVIMLGPVFVENGII